MQTNKHTTITCVDIVIQKHNGWVITEKINFQSLHYTTLATFWCFNYIGSYDFKVNGKFRCSLLIGSFFSFQIFHASYAGLWKKIDIRDQLVKKMHRCPPPIYSEKKTFCIKICYIVLLLLKCRHVYTYLNNMLFWNVLGHFLNQH